MEMNDHLQNIDVYQSLVGELTTTLVGEAPQLSGRQTAQALEALLPAQLADAGHGPPQLLSQLFGVGRRLHPADQGV